MIRPITVLVVSHQGMSLARTMNIWFTRKVLNFLIDDFLDHERLHHVGDELRVNVSISDPFVQQLAHRSYNGRETGNWERSLALAAKGKKER